MINKLIILFLIAVVASAAYATPALARPIEGCGPTGDEPCPDEAPVPTPAPTPSSVSGQLTTDPNCSYPDYRVINGERVTCPPKSLEGFSLFITRIFNLLFGLFVIAGSFIILWAGFLFLQSEGNPEKTNEARRMVVYAIIALVIGVFAWGLPRVILAML